MDIQRSILIVALAVVSYLMVLQWNEDYGQAALPAEVSTSTAATPALPDTPAATASTSGDDIPTAVAEPTAAAVAPTAAVSDDLIRVKTECWTWPSTHVVAISCSCVCRSTRVVRTARTFRSSYSITATSVPTWHRAA